MARLIDISPRITERIAVWPGDEPYRRKVSLDITKGDHLGLSSIHTTVHLGAHTDAPIHYVGDGEGIAARPLELYYGPCQVVRVRVERGARILPADLADEVTAARVLLDTGSFPDPDHFNEDFNSLSPELVDALHQRGVRLIGIDTPSIDPCHDKELLSHHRVAAHDMAVLEGIVLSQVVPGHYTLIALPLPLDGADASPVRAALLAENDTDS